MDILLISKNIINGRKGSAGDKGIELKLNIDKTIKSKLLGDPTRLTQVLSNLIHNGIKFTKEGSVELILFAKEQCEKAITIEFRVKDTGIGISEEKQKLIFERFTQADSSTSRGFGGTGLGLAISKKILELQDSSLHLESIEGQGSDFYFIQTFEKCLQSPKTEAEAINIPLEEDRPLSGIKILLVEDNPMNVMVAQKFLERWGAKTDIATNGLEALEMVDPKQHSLVLIDLHMPVMDGYEASRKMREIGIKLPIIALTANLPKEVEEKVRKSGINDIVVKPFLPDELYRMVLHYVLKKK
jgi:CheY-like chemotaxis protein